MVSTMLVRNAHHAIDLVGTEDEKRNGQVEHHLETLGGPSCLGDLAITVPGFVSLSVLIPTNRVEWFAPIQPSWPWLTIPRPIQWKRQCRRVFGKRNFFSVCCPAVVALMPSSIPTLANRRGRRPATAKVTVAVELV